MINIKKKIFMFMIYRNPLLEDVEIVNDQYILRNPGYTNDRTLNALNASNSIFYNKPILEMFGLGTYKDQNVIDGIDEVLDELIDYINKSVIETNQYIIYKRNLDIDNVTYKTLYKPDSICELNNETKIYTKHFECYIDNDWIETLNIYVTFDFNKEISNNIENDYMGLSNHSAEYIQDDIKGIMLRKNNIIIKDINKPRKHVIEEIRNKMYTNASVLIIVRDLNIIDKKNTDIDYILMHELEHFYYRLINNLTNIQDNSDVIENAFELKDINLIIKYGHLT